MCSGVDVAVTGAMSNLDPSNSFNKILAWGFRSLKFTYGVPDGHEKHKGAIFIPAASTRRGVGCGSSLGTGDGEGGVNTKAAVDPPIAGLGSPFCSTVISTLLEGLY